MKQKTLFVAATAAEAKAAAAPQISAWLPDQDPIRLAILGKLIEECSELAARAARCIIQGIEERDPATGRLNGEELMREMADVIACIETAESQFGVKVDSGRIGEKYDGFRRWHGLIRTAQFEAEEKAGRPLA